MNRDLLAWGIFAPCAVVGLSVSIAAFACWLFRKWITDERGGA